MVKHGKQRFYSVRINKGTGIVSYILIRADIKINARRWSGAQSRGGGHFNSLAGLVSGNESGRHQQGVKNSITSPEYEVNIRFVDEIAYELRGSETQAVLTAY